MAIDHDQYLDYIVDQEDQMLEDSLAYWEWIVDNKPAHQVYEDMELEESAIVILDLVEHRASDAIVNTIVKKMVSALSLDDLDILGIATRGNVMDHYQDEYLEATTI